MKNTDCLSSPLHLLSVEFDKHERMRALWNMARLFEEKEYWIAVADVWVLNESLFQDMEILEDIWTGCGIHSVKNRHLVMDAEERKFLAALSDEISVWRGCVEANINGWSWTLDRERARFFAERFAPDGKPLIVEAKVRKRDVLAYFPRRGEEELVVHPQDIYDMDIMKLPPSMPTQVSYLYFLAQTGRLLEKEDPRIKAQLMANTAFLRLAQPLSAGKGGRAV